MISKYDQSPTDKTDDAELPRDSTLSNQTESFTRRTQARAHLSAKLKDRTPKAPALDENIESYISPVPCRKKIVLPGSAYWKGRRTGLAVTPNLTRSMSCLGKLTINEKAAGNHHASHNGEQWSEYMTLSQVHQILRPSGNRPALVSAAGGDKYRPNHGELPDIKINISSVPETYPNIKVTVNRKQTPKTLAVIGSNVSPREHPVKEKQPHRLHKITRSGKDKSDTLPKMASKQTTLVSANGGCVNSMTSAQCLKQLDNRRLGSADKTRKWIQENPLGPETNPEYDKNIELEIETVRASVKSNNSSGPSSRTLQDEGKTKSKDMKRVRFGSDKWLIKDNACLFD